MANPKKVILKIICAVIILTVLFFIARFLCFNVFIIPNWFSQSQASVETVTILDENSEIQITDGKIDELYNLIDKNKISKLMLFPDHEDMDTSDAGYFIIFEYSDGTKDVFRYGGLLRNGLSKENSDMDSYWIVGSKNQDLFDFIKQEIEK